MLFIKFSAIRAMPKLQNFYLLTIVTWLQVPYQNAALGVDQILEQIYLAQL